MKDKKVNRSKENILFSANNPGDFKGSENDLEASYETMNSSVKSNSKNISNETLEVSEKAGIGLTLEEGAKSEPTTISRDILEISEKAGIGLKKEETNAPLHLSGGNGDLTTSEGDLKIGDNNYSLKIGVAKPTTSGAEAGDVRIRAVGGTNRLMLGGGTEDTLTIKDGNVGIGMNNPSAKLEVNGDIKGKANLSIDGNVDIGTDSSNGKLDVRGDIYAGNSAIYFTKTDHKHTGTIGNNDGYAAIENSPGGLMILGRSSHDATGKLKRTVGLWEYLRVHGNLDVDNNVGIGTTTPSGKLDVRGKEPEASKKYERIITIGPPDGETAVIYKRHNGKNTYLGIESYNVGNTAKTPIVLQEYGGNVGIGTTDPTARLEVKGDIKADNNLIVKGNVDIGTDSSNGKLDVRGDIYAGNSAIYFTRIDRVHTGAEMKDGYAAIENSPGALIILGRRPDKRKKRIVGLWDLLQVHGDLDVQGNVGIGTTDKPAKINISGQIVQEDWKNVELQDGWSEDEVEKYYGLEKGATASFFRDKNGIVHLRGSMTYHNENKNLTIGNLTIFNLPEGYRPAYRESYLVLTWKPESLCYMFKANMCNISTSGNVNIDAFDGLTCRLDGITFRASGE